MSQPSSDVTQRKLRGEMWLGDVAPSTRVRLVGVEAGQGLATHLAAMGLVPGVQVLVVRNPGRGPVLVEVKGTRLALGRGMAVKIRVE
jgi:Fe2+ transport system protein FeoA